MRARGLPLSAASVLLALGAAGVDAACAGAPAASPMVALAMPGPGPLKRAAAKVENERCASCHADAAATWRASLHAQSWTNPVFQGSFAEEPSSFCRDCHAPEPSAPAIGVACVTCHDPTGSGDVLAAPRDPAKGAATTTPHRIVRDVAFATERACAGCHDFAFPDVEARDHDGQRMQRTTSEHHASRFAASSCATCHMPARPGGSREHGFSVAENPSLLRSALVVRAERRDDRAVLELAPGVVGHAVPTGDLFRRLVVIAEVIGADYQLIAREERPLARHFAFVTAESGAKVQREIADDRVQNQCAQHLELDLGPRARGLPIAWRVEWQRVQSMHGDRAEIAGTVVLAEGQLP